MSRSRQIFFLIALAALSGCEKWHWPPYEDAARDLFDNYRDQFVAVDAAMEQDQLVHLARFPTGGIRAKHVHGVEPALGDSQRAKYQEILGEDTFFSFYRHADVLTIPRSIPSIRGREYMFWYAHHDRPPDDPLCDDQVRKIVCGRCVVKLENEWFMGWAWYPSDEKNFDQSCAYLVEQEPNFE